ncbi:MAG: phospholipase D family protein [Polyangiales bacterium]
MHTATVTGPDGGLLRAARQVVGESDSALLCVAFADVPGVHFLERGLATVKKRSGARLLATTVFGTTTAAALNVAHGMGVDVRVLNPGSGGTYHPKLYLGVGGERVEALVGSANLTRGLAVNVEAASHLRGAASEQPLRELRDWAEDLWRDPRTARWEPAPEAGEDEAIDPELLRLIAAAAEDEPRFYTLGPSPKPNYVRDATPSGLYVETERSRERKGGPEVVPPWMLNVAWEVLRSRGALTNRELLDELRVHRSSAVCAVLARLPGVEAERGRGIRLRWVDAEGG